MRKPIATLAVLVLLTTACGSGSGSDERTIFVDFSHDEYASYFLRFFPHTVSVHPGTELVFRQTWTGEPHSVTGGRLIDKLMEAARPFREMHYRGEQIPEEPPPGILELEEKVVWAHGEDGALNQTAAQPCYIRKGDVPQDGKPCRTQTQPEFTGDYAYYNSGLIPYEGPQGNEHRVKLADDLDPGSYWFYCNVHGEFQSTEVIVKPRSAKVDSADVVSRRGREQINAMAEPLLRLYRDAAEDRRVEIEPPEGENVRLSGNFAGLSDPVRWDSAVNEFIPKTVRVGAGEKITWNLLGGHTISFGVPTYFPIITFAENGKVERNPRLDPPAGGARRPEEHEDGPPPEAFDGGSYDGEGFWSSGLVFGDPLRYTMRITKPGTYRYACLVHPPMVGTVEVRD